MRLPALFAGLSLLAATVAMPSTAKADTDGKVGIGGDLLLLVPVGDLSDGTGVLLGPVLRGGYRVLPPLEVTGRIGYLFGFNKSVGGGSSSLSDIPIWAGARYFFLDPDAGPYGGAEIGLNVLRASASAGGIDFSDSTTRFGFNLQAGYVISKELPIDFKLQFSHLNLLGQEDGETAALGIGLSAGYTYQF